MTMNTNKNILNGLAVFCLLASGSTVLAGQPKIQPASSPTAAIRAVTGATPTPWVLKKWSLPAVPWDAWFKDNALVTDKGKYVHFFWNAQDFKGNFEVKEKRQRLAAAALEIVKRLYPAKAKADWVKVDIVYVLERDEYGLPKWDSLERVAHIETLRSKAPKKPVSDDSTFTAEFLKKTFDKFDLF
jgi:hypothetical protein